jgi:uncharacterized protein (TIGR03437 family)
MLARVFVLLVFAAAAVWAQPTVFANGMVNAASSVPAGLPSGNIAQGSMFSIYGSNMGPAQSPPLSFPLKSSEGLGGVTVQVRDINQQTRFAILLFVSPGQINAVLPSALAVGQATLTVTYSNQTSASQLFNITRNSVGLLAWNQRGSGPGVIQQYHGGTPAFNDITNSAIPGDTGVLWGTGLGPVTFDESQQPVQSDLGVNAEIWVGGQRVPQTSIPYEGRSSAAGQDQLNFVIPNITGCYVPVFVKIGNVVSNTVTMAIGTNGGMCSDPLSFGGLDPSTVRANGLKQGFVNLSRSTIKSSLQGISLDLTSDGASGSFSSYDWLHLLQSRGQIGVSVFGACTVTTFAGDNASSADPVIPVGLDAGTLTLTGQGGLNKTFQNPARGAYSLSLGSSGLPGFPSSLSLVPGSYTVAGTGGADVGAFTATLTLPQPFTWTNVDLITSVTRGNGQMINWTGGAGYVIISGYSMTTSPQKAGAYFTCVAQASSLQFMVPPEVLLALPPSGTDSGVSLGFLSVFNQPVSVPFNANGLNVAAFSANYSIARTVAYQ